MRTGHELFVELLVVGLEVVEFQVQDVPVFLDLQRQLPVVHSHVLPVVVVEEGFEGVLEVRIGALDEGSLLRVEVLVREVDSLAVHLL